MARNRFFERGASRLLSLTVSGAVALAVPACGSNGNERWVTTENTKVDIDWDAVAKAYKEAEGPEDLERRVNEIYEGDEIISISVQDLDERTQVVTGFFDNNTNGQVEDDEKIFSIERTIGADQSDGSYQISGYGPYAGYRSPMWDIAAGMMLGSFISRAFMPGYRPMYTTAYVTPTSRHGAIKSQRNAYRQANPQKFQRKSQSGRSYGKKGGSYSGGKSTPTARPRSGGGRFGLRRPSGRKVLRLG
ncbi:MAG: hypothetical protein R6X02_04660 [Enhygromyxa sp.]